MIFHVSNILGGDDKVMEFREKRWRNSGGMDRRCQHILLMKMVRTKTYRERVGGVHSGDKGVIQLLNSDSSLMHLRMWKSFKKCPERGRVLNLRSQMSQGGILNDTFKGAAMMILLREGPTLQLVMTFISRQSWFMTSSQWWHCESCKEQTKSSRWLTVGGGGKEWEERLEVQSGAAVTREGIEKWRWRGAWSDQRVWPRTSENCTLSKEDWESRQKSITEHLIASDWADWKDVDPEWEPWIPSRPLRMRRLMSLQTDNSSCPLLVRGARSEEWQRGRWPKGVQDAT